MNDWEPHVKAVRALAEELTQVSAVAQLLVGQDIPPSGPHRTVRDVVAAMESELAWFRDTYKDKETSHA